MSPPKFRCPHCGQGFSNKAGYRRHQEEAELFPCYESNVYECWCGTKGTYEQLCDSDGLRPTCGGTGHLDCLCGGDMCVCHHHGEAECFGCPDCDEDLGYDDWREMGFDEELVA